MIHIVQFKRYKGVCSEKHLSLSATLSHQFPSWEQPPQPISWVSSQRHAWLMRRNIHTYMYLITMVTNADYSSGPGVFLIILELIQHQDTLDAPLPHCSVFQSIHYIYIIMCLLILYWWHSTWSLAPDSWGTPTPEPYPRHTFGMSFRDLLMTPTLTFGGKGLALLWQPHFFSVLFWVIKYLIRKILIEKSCSQFCPPSFIPLFIGHHNY